jgi:DnaJ family protein B protein 4
MASHYVTLGLAADADEKAVRRAYKKLAVKWHPDRNLDNQAEATAEFKKVGEAYSVLSDVNERAAYDRHLQFGGGGKFQSGGGGGGGGGEGGGGYRGHGGMHGGVDPDEIFRAFFGGQSPFGDMMRGGMGGGGPVRFTFSAPGMSMGSPFGGGGSPFAAASANSFGGGGGLRFRGAPGAGRSGGAGGRAVNAHAGAQHLNGLFGAGGGTPGVHVVRCDCCSRCASIMRWGFVLYIFFWMFPAIYEELAALVS